MALITKAPGKYVQAPYLLDDLGTYVREYGQRVLLVTSQSNLSRIKNRLELTFAKADITVFYSVFGTECTIEEIETVVLNFSKYNCDFIIGCGGGKVIDTARAAADWVKAPLVVMPTAASNDSPCSALSVIHDKNGKVTELRQVHRNPDLVLVDTDIILNAPVRLFVAGMGDALATWFEARACAKAGAATTAGGVPSYSALCLAELCYKTLIEHGTQAKHDAESKKLTEDFEKVVHANTYLSGIGFESGGVAAAHGINDGFSVIPEAAKILHGELVGFGTLCLLMLEKADENEIANVAGFMCSVGLPVTLGQLGFDNVTEEFLLVVADAACMTHVMGNMPFEVTPKMVFDAIVDADAYGKQMLERK